ncbi:nuclear transport factor 2 family protein [Arthrobacter sp. UYEF20]|uniref:nuclear transport factor 2 family protein n=1 Tax=Arthrobacter sp. UYEF20 TaxID=1756363 RepID=UPI003394281E
MTSKAIVIAATTALFINRDLTAIDTYFDPSYVQHSTLVAGGIEGLRALASNLPTDFAYTPVRAYAEGDLVVTQGLYAGFGPAELVGFDVWRVENDRIVEHWDSLVPVAEETVSGRTQTDGPVAATDLDKTAQNKALVLDWVEKVLVGADYSLLTDYVTTGLYAQHNVEAADNLDGFGAAAAAWGADGKLLAYKAVHQVVAEGDFVFTRAEGEFGVPVIYNDLWRIENGKIVEHWDAIAPVPAELPHTNGIF